MPAASSSAKSTARSRPWGWIIFSVALIALFPPFRIVSQSTAIRTAQTQAATIFDPRAAASAFWITQLQPAAANAPELKAMLVDLRSNPAAAKSHGHEVGLGGPVYFFGRSTGRVMSVERSRVVVAIDGLEGTTVALRTGPVFGNTVRDGCGLLDVNRAPGLQEFNALSAELNRLVEERVLPGLRTGVAVGTRLTFAGCAELPEQVGDGPLLTIIPVQVEVKP